MPLLSRRPESDQATLRLFATTDTRPPEALVFRSTLQAMRHATSLRPHANAAEDSCWNRSTHPTAQKPSPHSTSCGGTAEQLPRRLIPRFKLSSPSPSCAPAFDYPKGYVLLLDFINVRSCSNLSLRVLGVVDAGSHHCNFVQHICEGNGLRGQHDGQFGLFHYCVRDDGKMVGLPAFD